MVRPPRNPQPEKEKYHSRWVRRQGRGPSLEEGEEERSRVMEELMEIFKVGDKHQSVISTAPHHTLVTKDSESLAEIGLNTCGSSECVGEKQELGSGSAVASTDCGKLFYNFMEIKEPPMTAVTPRDSFERNEAMLISNMELLMKEREKVWEEIQEMKNKCKNSRMKRMRLSSNGHGKEANTDQAVCPLHVQPL